LTFATSCITATAAPNAFRLHREVGDIPSAEFEADWHRRSPAIREVVTT
jgi:hypothetical protein